MLNIYNEGVFDSALQIGTYDKQHCPHGNYTAKRLVMPVCEWKGVKWSFSCIAGKFLQYRKRGGKILVLQLNALLLE